MTEPKLIEHMLRSAAIVLGMIPLDDLEDYFLECSASSDRANSLGPILDPTAYWKSITDGTLEDADRQLEIAKHLLAARKAIEKREQAVKTHRP